MTSQQKKKKTFLEPLHLRVYISKKEQGSAFLSASLCRVHEFRPGLIRTARSWSSLTQWGEEAGGWSTFPVYGIVILLIIYEGNEFWQWEGCPPQPLISTGPWPNGIIILLVPILIKHLSKWHERLRQGKKILLFHQNRILGASHTVCVFYFWFRDKCV